MKFQKINENVIKCVLTQEDMLTQGINIDDLMDDRNKAEEFLQYVLSKARIEADFRTNGEVLNVQLSVMKDGGISMMISDDQNAAIRAIAQQFKEKLREISSALSGVNPTASGEADGVTLKDAKIPVEKPPVDIYSKERIIRYIINNESESETVSYNFWARLSSIDDCVNMAKALAAVADSKASLYKYYGEYYLSIKLAMTKSEVAKNVFIMSEYSDDVSSENNDYLMVGEHGELIIKDTAIRDLMGLGE